jgi:hypothetical protein
MRLLKKQEAQFGENTDQPYGYFTEFGLKWGEGFRMTTEEKFEYWLDIAEYDIKTADAIV